MKRVLLLAALCAPGTALAQGDIPHVEVDDLPPLPDEDDSGTGTSIAVAAAAAAEEDVVVGAAKREQSLGNVASAVTVVTGDRLRRMGYRTVAEALRGVAGVFIADDHVQERVGVRGLQVLGDFNTRILVLVDGATVNEPWGQFAGVGWDAAFSIDDIARIEVIRGPVSSVYGTNAFFGIINVVTRGAAESPRAWGRIGGSQYKAGSMAAGFALGGVDRQLRGSVAALTREGESLNVPELGMPVDADAMAAISAGLVGAYKGAFGQLRFFRRRRELPFAPYETVIGDPGNRNYDTQLMAEGGYTRELSERVSITGRGYVNRYRFRDFLVLDDGTGGVFTDIGDSLWYGAEVRTRVALVGEDTLGVTAGGEATFIRTESESYTLGDQENGTLIDTPFNVQGLYAELDGSPTEWFAFTAGVRADRNSLLDDRVSPRAALFVSQGDRYGAKALYSEGFRNPSAFEGFFDDDTDFTENRDIGAEVIRSYEGVLWGRPLSGLTVRASGFLWDATGIVEQEEVTVDGEPRLQFQNVRDLRSTGIEVEGSYRSSAGWLAFGGVAYAKVEDGEGAEVPGAPALQAVLAVSSPLLGELAHLSAETHVVGPRPTRDPMIDTATYAGVSLVAYAPDVGGFDLTVGVRNLLGTREEVPAPEDFDREDGAIMVLPGEGREVYARLGYRY